MLEVAESKLNFPRVLFLDDCNGGRVRRLLNLADCIDINGALLDDAEHVGVE